MILDKYVIRYKNSNFPEVEACASVFQDIMPKVLGLFLNTEPGHNMSEENERKFEELDIFLEATWRKTLDALHAKNAPEYVFNDMYGIRDAYENLIENREDYDQYQIGPEYI